MQQTNLDLGIEPARKPDLCSDNWYTPDTGKQPVLSLIRRCLRGIDLDPCADKDRRVPAITHYTYQDDGLAQDWKGSVFMNPPYNKPEKWLLKLTEELVKGYTTEAIALLKIGQLNNQGTGKLIKLYASAICHWHFNGRIKFIPGENLLEERRKQNKDAPKSADFDTVLVYFGFNPGRFEETFDPYGMVTFVSSKSRDH